jgi:biotin synthase-related radical SAM superfamily protein
LNLGADDADEKSVDEVLEVVLAAREGSGITYVDFNTGHYEGDTYLDILEPYIVRVKEATNLLIGVQTPPHHDLKRYAELRRMGVNRVSFCFELFNRERFEDVCPGKHRQYGLDRYLEAIEYCANEVPAMGRDFEPWVSNGEIIAGLEPPEDSIAAIDWIAGVGGIPTVCVFRPLVGTDYSHLPPPETEAMVPVFRRLYEACMENGLPIGVAPNVHVSLVMLPDECRGLSERPYRFWLGELKLAAMRRAFARRFRRELRAADARRPAAARVAC